MISGPSGLKPKPDAGPPDISTPISEIHCQIRESCHPSAKWDSPEINTLDPTNEYVRQRLMNTPPPLPVPTSFSLPDALRRYWKNLFGVAISPLVVFAVNEFFHVPIEFLMPIPFFALFSCAQLWRKKRVPYSFCFIATGMWAFGVPVATFLIHLWKTLGTA